MAGRLIPALFLGAALVAALGACRAAEVRVGSAEIDSGRLPRGTETYRGYRVVEGQWTPTSTTVQTIRDDRVGGIDVLRIDSIHTSPDGDVTDGSIVVRRDDLSLLHHRVKAATDSMAVTCDGRFISGWVVLPDEPPKLLDLTLDHPVFPVDGPQPWLVSALSLAADYSVTVPRFSPWSRAEVDKAIEVLGTETIEHHGADTDCWVVDAGPLGPPGYTSYLWIDRVTRRILRGALRGAEGTVEYLSEADPQSVD